MQPSNLRRMLTTASETSRLETVMRLLPPLGCRLAPAGARTPGELVEFLSEQGRRRGLSWDELGQADPGRISLAVVMRVVSSLGLELTLIDDAVGVGTTESSLAAVSEASSPPTVRAASSPPVASSPASVRPVRTAPRRPSSSRRSSVRAGSPAAAVLLPTASSPGRDASSSEPRSPPAATTARNESSPASSSTAGIAELSPLGPLRPPRLGRYRDEQRERPPPRPAPTPWTPRDQSSALEGAVAEQLGDFSGADWRDLFALVWSGITGAAALPVQVLEGLGNMTAAGLGRLRRRRSETPTPPNDPDLSGVPDEWLEAFDARMLVPLWMASHAPGYTSSDFYLHQAEDGLRAGHVALDKQTLAVVRLAPRGRPHHLIDLIHLSPQGERQSWMSREVPLTIAIGGERHLLRHLAAGPIVAELLLADRAYFLAAVSIFFVFVEVRGEAATLVWGGRAEMLPKVVLNVPSPEPQADQTPTSADTPPVSTGPAPSEARSPSEAELRLQRALHDEQGMRRAAEAARTTALQERDDEQRRRLDAERARATADEALEARVHEIEDERQRRQIVEHELAGALEVLKFAEHAALTLQAEIRAQSQARTRYEHEARLTGRILKKALEMLTLHGNEQELRSWRRQLLAELMADANPHRTPRDQEEVARVLDQLGDALEKAERQEQPRSAPIEPACADEPDLLHRVERDDKATEVASDPVTSVQTVIATADAPQAVAVDPIAGLGPPGSSTSSIVTDAAPAPPPDRSLTAKPAATSTGRATMFSRPPLMLESEAPSGSPPSERKVGRNEPCPCGSGKKFKRCCWRS